MDTPEAATDFAEVTGVMKSVDLDVMDFTAIAVFCVAVFIIGIVGNSIVIYVLFRKRQTWNITTTYLFNLALADAIFVCTLPLWAQAYLDRLEWKFGLFLCKFVGVVGELNMYASIFFLTAMSVDRWVAVVLATTINTARSSVVAKVVCVLVWLAATMLSIPRMMYQELREYSVDKTPNVTETSAIPISTTTFTTLVVENASVAASSADARQQCMFFFPKGENKILIMGLLEFIHAVVGFVIPMTIICVCYLRILRTVRRKLISRRVRKERVAALAGIIITAFFICWLPRQLMTLYSAISGWWHLFEFDENFYQRFYPFCVCLAYANSCVNPFIYAFTATNFKNNVKEVCGSSGRGCKDNRGYKMTLAREDDRRPFSPGKNAKTQSTKVLSHPNNEKEPLAAKPAEQKDLDGTDIYEPFDPAEARRCQGNGNIGARGPPQCQHLAIDDTTSGIYYEYFSCPAVLQTRPEVREHKPTTRADIINHNNITQEDKAPAAQSMNGAPDTIKP